MFFLEEYSKVIYEFLVELYLFVAIFTFRLNRRRLFAIRLLAGLAVMAGVGYVAMVAYHYFGAMVWGRVLIYFLLFALVIVHAAICFDESKWTVLFMCDMAYAAQNLTYKLYLTIWCWVWQYELYPKGYPWYLFQILYYSFFAVCLAASYFLFARRTYRHILHRKQDYRTIIISLVILATTLILCSVEDVCFISLSAGGENQFDSPVLYYIRQAGNLFSIFCCTIVMLYMSGILERGDLKQELNRMQYSMAQAADQYEISKATIEQINIKCHDMRHRVKNIIEDAGSYNDIDKELEEAIRVYDANIRTGNKILDVILTEKSLYCEKNGITLTCMVKGEKLSFMRQSDLYCLFGNIIDNAIEAVSAIPDEQKRVINLTAREQWDLLVIEVQNYYQGSLEFVDGLPQTTKSDRFNHGYGMKSIRMIVRAYGGEMTVSAEDGIFRLSILLNCSTENTTFAPGR